MANSSAVTSLAQLQGLAKQVYAKLLEDVRVEETFLQDTIEFDVRAQEGQSYHQDIALTQNVGHFYDGPDLTSDMTNYPPVAMETGDLTIRSYQYADRLRLSYDLVSRLSHGDQASFLNAYGLRLVSIWKSARRNIELSLIYGTMGLAQVTSIPVAASGGAITVGFNWGPVSPGVFQASENTTIQFIGPAYGTVTYSGSSGAQTVTIAGLTSSFVAGASDAQTALNAQAAIQANVGASLIVLCTVSAGVLQLWCTNPNTVNTNVSLAATGTGATASGATLTAAPGVRGSGGGKSMQIARFTDAPVGGVPALKCTDFNSATVSTSVSIGDILMRSPEFGVSPAGIDFWITNTALGAYLPAGSVVTFNIDPSNYSAYRATVIDLQNKKFSIARLFDAVSQAQDKGLAGEVSVLVSPKLYAQLLGEAEGTVQKDYSYKKQDFEGGFKGVTLTSYTGDIILVPHRYIKRSECFVLELDELVQVGATKLVEKLEGKMVPSFMLDAPNGLYQESRLFANFNLVMKAPAHMLKVKNIGYDS